MDLEAHNSSNDHETVSIAPDGDVLLIVGPQKQQLRVYSLILRNASKPFSTLLGPEFSEGQALRKQLDKDSSKPFNLPLPEDDFHAMVTIFSVLHGLSRECIKKLTPTEVLKVAVAADKWACTTALSWAAKDWLSYKHVTESTTLWLLMLAAYFFEDEECFSSITGALVLHVGTSQSYWELQPKTDVETDAIDDSKLMVIRAILQERRANLCLKLINKMMSLPSDTNACECISSNGHDTLLLRDLHNVLGFDSKSLWNSLQAVLDMRYMETKLSRLNMQQCSRNNVNHDPYFRQARGQLVTELQTEGRLGISLRSIRHGYRAHGNR